MGDLEFRVFFFMPEILLEIFPECVFTNKSF